MKRQSKDNKKKGGRGGRGNTNTPTGWPFTRNNMNRSDGNVSPQRMSHTFNQSFGVNVMNNSTCTTNINSSPSTESSNKVNMNDFDFSSDSTWSDYESSDERDNPLPAGLYQSSPSKSVNQCFLIYNKGGKLSVTYNSSVSSPNWGFSISSNTNSLPQSINLLYSTLPKKAVLLMYIFKKFHPQEVNYDILKVLRNWLFRTLFICDKCHRSLSTKDNLIHHLHRCMEWPGCDSTFLCRNCSLCPEMKNTPCFMINGELIHEGDPRRAQMSNVFGRSVFNF